MSKLWFIHVTETQRIVCQYCIKADTKEEAIEKAEWGATEDSVELELLEVSDREIDYTREFEVEEE